MPSTWIKICGVRDPETALAAVEAGADAVGLNFVMGSPRLVNVDQALAVVQALPKTFARIGLFAGASAEEIRAMCGATDIRAVQLHGNETPEFAASLAPLVVYKALHYRAGIVNELARWTKAKVAGIFIDAPPRGGLTGGGGQPFSWKDLAEEIRRTSPPRNLPLILAGGLNAQNVGDAIRLLHPFGVDVSSGVESSRGVKDAEKIRAFCAAVREADA